ncbi:MAG: hypothetical protein ABI832_21305 [bacterium]
MRFQHHQSSLGRFLEDRTAGFYHLWGSAILLLGAGMDSAMTGLWLPRAGAVVAGAAAYTYFFDPRTSDDWWALRRKGSSVELDSANVVHVPAPNSNGTKAEAQRSRRIADQAKMAQKLSDLAEEMHTTKKAAMRATNHLHHAALQAQGIWVLIGTFVWAFGDIPVELMKCGAIPC